ncbi:hypothetical protein STXM2123_5164 [Streptomyces sp. F-3]|nr:hypothetical protein STXM2123_5164 [Streptomyces sp. F-3]
MSRRAPPRVVDQPPRRVRAGSDSEPEPLTAGAPAGRSTP